MLLGPLYFLQQITEIPVEGNVMFVRFQFIVEELIVRRVLFQDERIPAQQIG